MPKASDSTLLIPPTLSLPALGESLGSLTGEDTRLPRLSVPQISISYKDEDDTTKAEGEKKGHFVQYDPATKQRTALGASVTVQVLHYRQKLSSFSDTEQFFTPEVSLKAESLPLFRLTKGADGKSNTRYVGKVTLKTRKTDYPNLTMQRVAYVLHDGALKSFIIKGASFTTYIDLQKKLGGVSTSSVHLVLTTEKGKKGTVTYYSIIFTPGEKSDLVALKPVMTELSEWFAQYDALQAAQQKDKADQAALERGDGAAVSVTAAPASPASAPLSDDEAIAADLFDKSERAPVTEEDLTAAGL
jgi:hypothetical protein